MILACLCGWRSAQNAGKPGSPASKSVGASNSCQVVIILLRRHMSKTLPAWPSEEVIRLMIAVVAFKLPPSSVFFFFQSRLSMANTWAISHFLAMVSGVLTRQFQPAA